MKDAQGVSRLTVVVLHGGNDDRTHLNTKTALWWHSINLQWGFPDGAGCCTWHRLQVGQQKQDRYVQAGLPIEAWCSSVSRISHPLGGMLYG